MQNCSHLIIVIKMWVQLDLFMVNILELRKGALLSIRQWFCFSVGDINRTNWWTPPFQFAICQKTRRYSDEFPSILPSFPLFITFPSKESFSDCLCWFILFVEPPKTETNKKSAGKHKERNKSLSLSIKLYPKKSPQSRTNIRGQRVDCRETELLPVEAQETTTRTSAGGAE